MPLFLVTNVCDEGVYESSFRVVEAPSRVAVAEYVLRHPDSFRRWLEKSHLWDGVADRAWDAAGLLAKCDATWVDGDSAYQFSIREVPVVERWDGVPPARPWPWAC